MNAQQIPEWQKRLVHERVCRDALIACGNAAPTRPDPTNGLIQVRPVLKFNGKVYSEYLNGKGHTHSDYSLCACAGRQQ